MISVVIVYNNVETLDQWTLSSLNDQDAEHEVILLDNRTNAYPSAANALNIGCRKASGDYIMCVHQDVRFERSDFLRTVEKMMGTLDHAGAAGVAGMSSCGRTFREKRRNRIYHGYPDRKTWGNSLETPETVQTLDECLVVIPRSVMGELPYDEVTCDDWHFYAVDYCLSLIERGYKVYALPLPIYHKSTGESARPDTKMLWQSTKSKAFYRAMRRVLNKHKGSFSTVAMTSGVWTTGTWLPLQRAYHYVRQKVFMQER